MIRLFLTLSSSDSHPLLTFVCICIHYFSCSLFLHQSPPCSFVISSSLFCFSVWLPTTLFLVCASMSLSLSSVSSLVFFFLIFYFLILKMRRNCLHISGGEARNKLCSKSLWNSESFFIKSNSFYLEGVTLLSIILRNLPRSSTNNEAKNPKRIVLAKNCLKVNEPLRLKSTSRNKVWAQ